MRVYVSSVETGTKVVEVRDGGTVAESITKAGMSAGEYTVELNGAVASLDTIVKEGDYITTTKNYDGGVK